MVLNEECKGALNYDYVIGTSEDMLKTRQYTKVLKNQEELKSAFAYMDKGTWYVACHAWLKGEDGKKVFGQWSEIHKVDVSAITPQTPVISKVTFKGSTVTVKYTKSKNAQGYDVVLSDTLTKTNGQKRPAVSGENYYVKKIKGKYYYFDKKGLRKSGWMNYKGHRYYFDKKTGEAYVGKHKI